MNRKLTARLVSSKRHTVGFIVDSERLTRHQTSQLVKSGYIRGAVVRRNGNKNYVALTSGSIYDLPEVVVSGRNWNRN